MTNTSYTNVFYDIIKNTSSFFVVSVMHSNIIYYVGDLWEQGPLSNVFDV